MAACGRALQFICRSHVLALRNCTLRPCTRTWVRRYEQTQPLLGYMKNFNSALIQTDATEIDKEGLNITPACVEQMKKVASPSEFLRVVVEGGGCSGFTYSFELDDNLEDDDRTFERDGIKIVCDEGSLALIKGSSIDYEEELIKSSFRIKHNPQSNSSCSCGVSFSVDL